MTGVTSAMAYIPYVQDRPEEGKAGPGLRDGIMKPDKDQPPPDRNDPRYIARRVFKALCAHYPDRYIALIEQPYPERTKPTQFHAVAACHRRNDFSENGVDDLFSVAQKKVRVLCQDAVGKFGFDHVSHCRGCFARRPVYSGALAQSHAAQVIEQ
jgi:hypothetical protein